MEEEIKVAVQEENAAEPVEIQAEENAAEPVEIQAEENAAEPVEAQAEEKETAAEKEAEPVETMADFAKELEESYKLMGDGEYDTDTLLAWQKIQEYLESKEILTVEISGIVNKGVIALVEGIRGFVPVSRLDIKPVDDTNPWLGREIRVRVIEANMEKGKLVLSAREILREEAAEAKKLKIADIKVGEVREGTVESLQTYGAFIDLGDGISGLLHISQISEKRIKHPKAVLEEGQKVTVKVIKNQDGKVGLSMKALIEATEKEEEAEHIEIPKSESISTSLGDLLKNIKL